MIIILEFHSVKSIVEFGSHSKLVADSDFGGNLDVDGHYDVDSHCDVDGHYNIGGSLDVDCHNEVGGPLNLDIILFVCLFIFVSSILQLLQLFQSF